MEVYGLKKRFCGILCIVLMGFLLTGCNVEFGFNRKSNVSNNAEGNVNERITIDGVDKINLQIAVADIDIYTVEGNDVIIERTCQGNNFGKLSIEKNGSIINRFHLKHHLELENVILKYKPQKRIHMYLV